MHHHEMSFSFGTDIGEFLFSGLNIQGLTKFSILCVVVFILSIIYEGLKVLETKSRARTAREKLKLQATCPANEAINLLNNPPPNAADCRNIKRSKKILLISSQAITFTLHTTLGYFIMLAAMVYNVYLFATIILGLGLGYFFFGHISMRINMENIRAKTTQTICAPFSAAIIAANSHEPNYVNELAESHSSTSSRSSDNYNNSNYTQTTTIEREVEVHCPDNDDEPHSCRL